MSLGSQQPFINSQAFDKANLTFVSFSTQADAMIASLQLFHGVPCRVMNLIFSVIIHPDFDVTQITLRNSTDVIDVVEESRLKDRMDVVHKRSLGDSGRMEQADFPEFVLDEVLDIIHAHRMDDIKCRFKEALHAEAMHSLTRSEGDDILKAMSLVHRSGTFPSQKTLGRALCFCNPIDATDDYQSYVRKSTIFGPWTSVVAIQMCQIECDSGREGYLFYDDFREDYRQWFENLHRILVSFTNLKSVLIQSYVPFFTKWFNFTIGELVGRNTHLEEVTLHTERYNMEDPFILDSLIENHGRSEYLRNLNLEGAKFSDCGKDGAMRHGTGFGNLKNLKLICSHISHEIDLDTLFILCTLSKPSLESVHIVGDYDPEPDFEEITARLFPYTQCADAFHQLRSLHLDGIVTDQWLKWIGPYCSSLKVFTLDTELVLSADVLSIIPTSIRILNLRLMHTKWTEIEEAAGWMKSIMSIFSTGRFPELKSFSLSLSEEIAILLESDEPRHQEAHKLRNQLREFEASMKHFCQSARVECSLDL